MHVLICAVSSSRHPTGICRHATNLARCLAASDEVSQITVLTGGEQARYFDSAFQLRDRKLAMTTVNLHNGSIARNYWYMDGLPKEVKVYGPDVVHLSFPAPVVRERFSCPVVTSLHDLYPYDIPANFGFPRVIFNRLFLRQCLRNSDTIVCGSDFTLNRLRAIAGSAVKSKAIRIYQSVHSDPMSICRPSLPDMGGRRFLLCVAQHRRNKNLDLLIRALADLRRLGDQHQELYLVIVGADGPETASLKKLIRQLALQPHVTLINSLADPELCWLYRNCELFVAPSCIEGFGLPVVEALQCGARVACSDIPAFREIAGDACRYFDLRAPSPAVYMAQAVSATLQERRRRPEGLHRFSAEEVAAQYVSLYSQLLAEQQGSASSQEPISTDQVPGYDRLAG
jgi:glycosyltransferase involved in cell wall biosynthesis